MERQLTLRMPGTLARALDRAARQMRRKRSEVVRLALEQYLNTAPARPGVSPVDLVRDLLGRVESGVPDLGQRHREYLLTRVRRAR